MDNPYEKYHSDTKKVGLCERHSRVPDPWDFVPGVCAYPEDDPVWAVWKESEPDDYDRQWVQDDDAPHCVPAGEAREYL